MTLLARIAIKCVPSFGSALTLISDKTYNIFGTLTALSGRKETDPFEEALPEGMFLKVHIAFLKRFG